MQHTNLDLNLLSSEAPLNLHQFSEVNRLVEEIINGLDNEALYQLTGGNEADIDKVFETLQQECAKVVYGGATPVTAAQLGYLDKFTESVEETLRIQSVNYFALSTMPSLELNWHHIEWGNLYQIYRWLCVIAARDHGKSHWFSFVVALWRLYRYQKALGLQQKFTDRQFQQGILITSEYGLANHLLEKIKTEVENNDILREKLYPSGKGAWNTEEIKTKNGAHLVVKSYGSKMRGWHPHWILVDDFLTDQALYSAMQRQKYIDFFHSVIMNMLVPQGRIAVVGTPYHKQDLYGNLKEAEGWRVFEYPALFPDGTILWNRRHSFDGLMGKRKSQGAIIFSREILVKPVTSDSAILPYETVARSFVGMENYTLVNNINSFPKKFVRVVTGCDFARSAKVGADYSVFITLGIDDLDRYWLLNIYRVKGASYSQQIGALRTINANFKPDIMVMESNQMQQLFVDGAKEANIPVEGHNTSAQSKYDLNLGLPSLVILFEQDRFKFPRGDEHSRITTDNIALELASITWTENGKLESTDAHDDIGMALWMSVQAARKGTALMTFI